MSSAEEEFLKAMQEYTPPPVVVAEYRAYYNEEFWIVGFSGSGFPEGDNWVAIDRDLYVTNNWTNLRLVDGKIKYIPPVYMHYFSLTKSKQGVKVVKNHAGIVVNEHEEYTDIEFYDNRNN